MEASLKAHIISQLTGLSSTQTRFSGVGGGCINDAWQITSGSSAFFCKINSAAAFPGLFAKEARGLKTLASSGCIRTPAVVGVHYLDDRQILLLEWIEGGLRGKGFWTTFGEQLARLHIGQDITANPFFGFDEDNYMGSLPQLNSSMDDWCDFFREKRLQPQIQLAESKGLMPASTRRSFDRLYDKLPGIFEPVRPSLLHGDLWSGNFLCSSAGEPVLIDPAVYYGHPSMDLAMTTLFGGFDKPFYESYNHWLPFPENHREQWEVCNLYPLLIHLNLFGSSYLSSIASALRRFQ